MIADFYTTTFTVKRSVWVTDIGNNPYSTEMGQGTFDGHLQQAAADLVQHMGLSLTKTFAVWCALGTDVIDGDTLETAEGTYSVRAIQSYAIGGNAHLELIVEQDDV